MKITNNAGLPESLVRAVRFSDYDKGKCDYSVTQLIGPPRISVLKAKHDADIVEDASERLWALLGSAGHEVLRRSAEGTLVEKRFFVDIMGKRISGQLDLLSTEKSIFDYKFTSVWAIKEGLKDEWEQQLNMYAWMAAKNQLQIKKLFIVAIARDWSKNEAKRNPEYPQQQVKMFVVPVWPLNKTEAFIRERVTIHEAAKKKLPECTAHERWQKDDLWAVTKNGNKRALRLHPNEASAKEHLAMEGKNFHIEFRSGTSIRCESYCPVAPFCDQWKAIMAKMPAPEDG
jgi:hypothetical protein